MYKNSIKTPFLLIYLIPSISLFSLFAYLNKFPLILILLSRPIQTRPSSSQHLPIGYRLSVNPERRGRLEILNQCEIDSARNPEIA